jgi:hypothetical protein
MEHSEKSCCCNCKNQLLLFKHPWNKEIGRGAISERLGYACIGFQTEAVFFEEGHGMCELWLPKTKLNERGLEC